MGNMNGNLFMLFLETGENSKGVLCVKDLKVELLGKFEMVFEKMSFKMFITVANFRRNIYSRMHHVLGQWCTLHRLAPRRLATG